MKIRIDEKFICIPPYISVTWEQVAFLHSEEDSESHLFTLVINLVDGKEVSIPKLDPSLIDIAFSAHIKYLEGKTPPSLVSKGGDETKTMGGLLQQLTGLSPEQLVNMPIRLGIAGMEGLPGIEVLHHNQSQSNTTNLPGEVLEKIAGMIKMMTNGDISAFPKPEPHCNCPHCQVARIIHGIIKNEEIPALDQPVSDEELKFRDWDITKQGEQLYTVTNPLDPKEHYNVFLGSPVGCTCGQAHCEHIKAVLFS